MTQLAQAIAAAAGTGTFVVIALYLGLIRPARAAVDQERRDLKERADRTLDDARADAERIVRVANEEIRERQANQKRDEQRLEQKEAQLEERRLRLENQEEGLLKEQRAALEREEGIDRRSRAIEEEIQRVAGLSAAEAKSLYLAQIEAEFHEIGMKKAKEAELRAVTEIERKAKKVVLDVIQRSVVDYVTEATLAVVELPSEDMKGRIIGREGRNIRAFEQVTGVDLIIDETPEAAVISSFDPVRRETARLTLMNLMLDGRIHPVRIEELYEKAQAEVSRMILEAGERAAERANVSGLTAKTIETMGRLRFRTSYAQNVLDHSVEVARLAENLAFELGLNAELAKRAGLLHDIGKALGPEFEGPHALTGMEFLRTQGEKDGILLAVGAHHNDIEPTSAEAVLVIVADTISAARPGARRENLENYLKRLTSLEALANDFPGVERSYAVQAGREVRLIVRPEEIDDLGASRLASAVAQRIENEMDYPGQIKITVIRERRAVNYAKSKQTG